jgi:hypothetical protein
MPDAQVVILYDSKEAAQRKTDVNGWVSRRGLFFGDDEDMARFDGATHKKCSTCGAVYSVNSCCMVCHIAEKEAAFDALPHEVWDGVTPLVVFDSDHYFFRDTVLGWLEDQPIDKVVRIAKCRPHYLSVLEEEHWADDLAEDGRLPDEVAQKLSELNALIGAAGPVSWFEDNVAIDVADLRARIAPNIA